MARACIIRIPSICVAHVAPVLVHPRSPLVLSGGVQSRSHTFAHLTLACRGKSAPTPPRFVACADGGTSRPHHTLPPSSSFSESPSPPFLKELATQDSRCVWSGGEGWEATDRQGSGVWWQTEEKEGACKWAVADATRGKGPRGWGEGQGRGVRDRSSLIFFALFPMIAPLPSS